ncbi:hypothetical protein DXG01_014084 [Tephrocybe rancida]|nr:hypothetical protein DXG01_014084 [Tephrocybe rancida]
MVEKIDLDGHTLQDLLIAEYLGTQQSCASPTTARQHAVFEQLMKITPNFRETIFTASEEELARISELSLKGVVIEWITSKGQPLNPPFLETFMDPDDSDEVTKLMEWWNRQVFPGHLLTSERLVNKDSALTCIKERRAQRKALREAGNIGGLRN